MELLDKLKDVKVKFWQVELTMQITWSKFMALLLLVAGVWLDLKNGGSSVTMYMTPFIVFLITGKQMIDARKEKVVIEKEVELEKAK